MCSGGGESLDERALWGARIGPEQEVEIMADALTQTSDERAALAASEVQAPNMPHAVFQEEASAMLAQIELDKALGDRLYKTRVTKAEVKHAKVLLGALLLAQREWSRVRAGRDAQELVDGVERAEALRADIYEAVDYDLEGDRVAEGRIAAIREGDGVPDLIDDLGDLRVLITDYEAIMRADALFDYDQTLKDIDDVLAIITPLRSDKVFDAERMRAKDTRDRAWTLAVRAIRAIRSGGRRAFSKDPTSLAFFQSKHEIAAKRRSRKAAQQP
jgi:hypothetical protein